MTRIRYLFRLARYCHCPPAAVSMMTVGDFAWLITEINRMPAEMPMTGGN